MEKLQHIDWNVVVNGFWNRAIFTPSGIAEKLFHLEKGTVVEVMVPVDAVGAIRVSYGDITVIPEERALIIEAKACDYLCLNLAMETARNAILALPETPVLAAGYNLRFKQQEYSGSLSEVIQQHIAGISDSEHEILSEGLTRQLRYGEGVINFRALLEGHSLLLEFNFHRESTQSQELASWLDVKTDSIQDTVDALLSGIADLSSQEEANA